MACPAGPEYHAIISFGLPLEPEDSQYGKSRLIYLTPLIPSRIVGPEAIFKTAPEEAVIGDFQIDGLGDLFLRMA